MFILDIVELLENAGLGETLVTLVVSMLPILELRGAIPIGVSLGMHPWASMLVSIIGNMFPVPFIILFVRPVFTWIRNKNAMIRDRVDRLVSHAEGKWAQVHQFQFWGLVILVAIPLPGTGAWTGALIAALTNVRLRNAIPAILLGVIIAAVLVTGMTVGFAAIFT